MEKCEICGKEFDSSRGLNIHKSQVHTESKEKDTETGSEDRKDKIRGSSISVTVPQALAVVFTLGLAVGFSTGIAVSSFNGQLISDMVPADNNEENNQEPTIDVIKDIASSTGLDGEQVTSCVESSNSEEINQDKQELSQALNRPQTEIGTPTFLIGNSEIGYTEISGAQPYSRMKPTIDQKIQEANEGNSTVGEEEYSLEGISFEGEPVMGNESAPINLIEYSDFGCPWCAEWHGANAIAQRPIDQENSFSQVRSNYVETGDVQFVFKDYPVQSLHPNAETAHKAANCVLENSSESFWDFSQKLYEERDRWN